MMIKTLANLFGAVFLLIGILGFIPALAPHGMLLKTFQVNTALNILHLFSGAAGLWCGLSSGLAAKVYFRFFAAVYCVTAMTGFFVGHGLLLGRITNNRPDTWLHLAFAVLFLIFGFAPTQEPAVSQVI
jgi:hypothetical protein